MERSKVCLLIGNCALLVAMAVGCDAQQVDEGEATALRPGSGAGGVWLNTSAIGTHAFSEIDLKGGKHDGVRLTRVSILQGGTLVPLDRVEFDAGGQLRGVKGTQKYSGAALVGSHWQLNLVAGTVETPASMWISAAEVVAPGETRYVFEHDDANGARVPVCDPDPAGSHAAVPIKNLTVDAATGVLAPRADTLYLACTSGAVGKAVDWGYKPWQRSIDDLEVAVRMVRADYCYDGRSWTAAGTGVSLRDRWGINGFVDPTHPDEAVWGKDHLLCLAAPRSFEYSAADVTCAGAPLPTCAATVDMTTYGADTRFWVKFPPQ